MTVTSHSPLSFFLYKDKNQNLIFNLKKQKKKQKNRKKGKKIEKKKIQNFDSITPTPDARPANKNDPPCICKPPKNQNPKFRPCGVYLILFFCFFFIFLVFFLTCIYSYVCAIVCKCQVNTCPLACTSPLPTQYSARSYRCIYTCMLLSICNTAPLTAFRANCHCRCHCHKKALPHL